MNESEKRTYKNHLKQYAQHILTQRIELSAAAVQDAQQSANGEGKSSAGDKYETSRAMSHLEKDMHSRQLAEHLKEQAALHAVDISQIYLKVQTGAFVQCGALSFFIGAGLGKQELNQEIVFFLSPHAPLTRNIMNKETGDSFLFNGSKITITDIY